MTGGFWLSDRAWAAIEPLLPRNQPGARRVDDRRVISGIIHVLQAGCRWQDCPPCYGPSTTIYNRFNRWSHKGLWMRIFTTLSAQAGLPVARGQRRAGAAVRARLCCSADPHLVRRLVRVRMRLSRPHCLPTLQYSPANHNGHIRRIDWAFGNICFAI
mgnify:CR=1 FL=1